MTIQIDKLLIQRSKDSGKLSAQLAFELNISGKKIIDVLDVNEEEYDEFWNLLKDGQDIIGYYLRRNVPQTQAPDAVHAEQQFRNKPVELDRDGKPVLKMATTTKTEVEEVIKI